MLATLIAFPLTILITKMNRCMQAKITLPTLPKGLSSDKQQQAEDN